MTVSNNRNTGKRVVTTRPTVDWENRSGTIGTGGTAQSLAAENKKRMGLWVQNQSAGSLWINDLGAATQAQPSLEIKTGETLIIDNGNAPSAAISIVGATTGQAFSAREW